MTESTNLLTQASGLTVEVAGSAASLGLDQAVSAQRREKRRDVTGNTGGRVGGEGRVQELTRFGLRSRLSQELPDCSADRIEAEDSVGRWVHQKDGVADPTLLN
jgi:hypothetical protein